MLTFRAAKSLLLLAFCFILWAVGIQYGDSLGGDIGNYREDFTQREIGDFFYSVSRDFFYLTGADFHLYHFSICLAQSLILLHAFFVYRISLLSSLIALIYLMSMGWIGHFRASFTIFVLPFYYFSIKFWGAGVLAHSGNVVNLIAFWMLKNRVACVAVVMLAAVFLVSPGAFESIFQTIGRERFFNAYSGVYGNDYLEHRNLWELANFKLWASVFVVGVTLAFGRGANRFFLLVPYSAYLIFGFDAYTAQKSYLNFSFMSVLGFSSLDRRLICTGCKIIVILDLILGSLSRWLVL